MERILVIDDEANIRMMLRMALEHDGYSVGQAADGPEGLARFGDGREWDLVLLDQRMPGMDGLSVLREMRKRDPDAQVIIITAFGTIDLVAEAMKAGARDFLRKPFTLETLLGAIEAVLLMRSEEPVPEKEGSHFSLTTLNGYRIVTVRGHVERRNGQIRQILSVRRPNGNTSVCEVNITPRVVGLIEQDIGEKASGREYGFWEALCEEVMANYLWQNTEIPFGGVLSVDEYSSGLRRWVLSCVTAPVESPDPSADAVGRTNSPLV